MTGFPGAWLLRLSDFPVCLVAFEQHFNESLDRLLIRKSLSNGVLRVSGVIASLRGPSLAESLPAPSLADESLGLVNVCAPFHNSDARAGNALSRFRPGKGAG